MFDDARVLALSLLAGLVNGADTAAAAADTAGAAAALIAGLSQA